MDCEKCQELLSEYLDGTLPGDERARLRSHLEGCLDCDGVRDELGSIVGAAHAHREYFVAPPNERALWLRVRNTIEAELDAELVAAARAGAAAEATRARVGFASRWINKRWALSLPQLTAAVAAIMVSVSLATVFGLQNLRDGDSRAGTPSPQPFVSNVGGQRNGQAQLMEIEYLRQRVDQRKARWNPRMRDAFDRNLQVIDTALSESQQELNQSPHDEISEDALNAALRGKMELLKEFSEL